MPMNPERKQKWLDALRSGEFPQCKSMLHNAQSGGYCCLGVAVEVYRRETGYGEWVEAAQNGRLMESYARFRSLSGDIDDLTLPPQVAEWYGLGDDPSPEVRLADVPNRQALTSLNDDHEWDFEQIADAIENDPDL